MRIELLLVWFTGFCDLPAPNQIILPEGLQIKGSYVWVVKEILDHQSQTNIVPYPLEHLMGGNGGANRRCAVLKIRAHERNEGIGAVFHHERGQALHEGLGGCVQVAEHGVALSPNNQEDGVGVDPHQEERHGIFCVEESGADVSLGEASLWAISADDVQISMVILSPRMM